MTSDHLQQEVTLSDPTTNNRHKTRQSAGNVLYCVTRSARRRGTNPTAMMSYGSMLVTASTGVLQSAQGGFPMPNSSATSTSTSVSELVSFGATENSRRFSVSSLLELEDLTAGGIKRGQDVDRSEGKLRHVWGWPWSSYSAHVVI